MKNKLEIPLWTSGGIFTIETKEEEKCFQESIKRAGFIHHDRVGHDALTEVLWYWRKEKDMYLVFLSDGNQDVLSFACTGHRQFLECYNMVLDTALKYVKLFRETEAWGKED